PFGAAARPGRAPGGDLRRAGRAADDPPRHDVPGGLRSRRAARARPRARAATRVDGWLGGLAVTRGPGGTRPYDRRPLWRRRGALDVFAGARPRPRGVGRTPRPGAG